MLDHATTTYQVLATDTNFVNIAAVFLSTASAIVIGQIPSVTAGSFQIQAYDSLLTTAKFSTLITHSFTSTAMNVRIGATKSAANTLIVFACSHETSPSSSLTIFYDQVREGNSQVVSFSDYVWSTCLQTYPVSVSEATFAIQDAQNSISV